MNFKNWRLWCCSIVIACIQNVGWAAADAALVDKLRLVAEGYQSNKSAFIHGKCVFTFAYRRADTIDDALGEKWNDQPLQDVLGFTYLFRGDALVVRTPMDGNVGEEIVSKMEGHRAIVAPINIAKQGDYALDYDGIVNTAIVYAPENNNLHVTMHPFNLAFDNDILDLAYVILTAEADSFESTQLEVVENAVYEDREYLLVKQTDNSTGAPYHYHHYVDPARGFLPFITEGYHSSGKLHFRMVLLEARQDGANYFPLHAMMLLPRVPTEKAPYIDVREMKVLELDLEFEPTDEDLVVHLPKNTQFSDGINSNTAKSLYRDGDEDFPAVSTNDIKGIYDELQTLAVEREEEAAIRAEHGIVQAPQSATRRYVLFAINAVLIAGVIVLFLWSRRKKDRQSA